MDVLSPFSGSLAFDLMGARALSPRQLGGDMDTMFPETTAPFEKALSDVLRGELGILSCQDLPTEPSPPRSANGSSTAAVLPSGLSAAGH